MKKPRKYAAFYDWHDKQTKELGIVRELVQALSAEGFPLRDPRIQEPDPPDCVCVDDAGQPIALEVVELVSQEAIERNERGEHVYRWWESEDIRAEVKQLLARKDGKTFNGGPYADVAVLIHTDEPALTADAGREALAGVEFGPFKQLTRAFLMFSYMPGKGHEVLHLSVVTHNNGLHRTAVSGNEG
jgi:hypothetical protein